MPFDGWLPHNKAGVRNSSNKSLYTDATREMVGEIANEEIHDFSYSFGESFFQ